MKPIIFQNFALSVKFELYHLISFISILNISWGVVGYRDNLLLDSCHNILLFIYFLNCVFLSRQWLMIFYTLLMMCTSKFLWLLNVMQRFSSVNNCKANCVFPHSKRQLIHFNSITNPLLTPIYSPSVLNYMPGRERRQEIVLWARVRLWAIEFKMS